MKRQEKASSSASCFYLSSLLLLLFLSACNNTPSLRWSDDSTKVLVFSKTSGYRHESIEAGREALLRLGQEAGYAVTLSENADVFTDEQLAPYAAVVFLNTTGDVLNAQQQAAFERYIRSGGSFVGVHAATDTEYDWGWYGELVGARFDGHPEIQAATLHIVDREHPASGTLPSPWQVTDEWYNFREIAPDITVLIEIDEASYSGGTNGDQHPIAWYREFDGGRTFYTAMGHTEDSYSDPQFLNHLGNGLAWAIGEDSALQAMPQQSQFERLVLDSDLNEPMQLDEIPGQGILFVERRGAVKFYDFAQQNTQVLAELDVFYGNEDGLLGLAVDPDYENNHWIYLFYTAPLDQPLQRISRFTLEDGQLDLGSEQVLLEIPTDRLCCHTGGGLEFGVGRELYIGVGDNTTPFASDGYTPIDERQYREAWDAQRSSANSMDLRGKILRIRVEDDGSYSIPEGNLFAPGTAQTRPEIYIMGNRNPFRFAIDSKSGDLIWGDVGPDAGRDNPLRGPSGMGEFNRAAQAGNWGWPYTRGNNQAYIDYDFEAEQSGQPFDPENLENDSPNNTGMRRLPPAQESFVWYSFGLEEQFPWLGSGGITPMVGPFFYREDFAPTVETFPPYFEGSALLYEWMRDWIVVVHFDKAGKRLRRVERFMPDEEFSHPMDVVFGSDGSLYLLEYGQKWNQRNPDARLNRIRYVAEGVGSPNPVLTRKEKVVSDKPAGQLLVESSDCSACHGVEAQVNGPSYKQISERYGKEDTDYLVEKIIQGGSGVWGERHMSPHPQHKNTEVQQMVDWILSLNPANHARAHTSSALDD
jgi:cytochrome c